MLQLADRLRGLRGTESQTAFAARFGLKQAIYSHYETGRKKPSLEVLVDMAQKLGVTTDYLLGLSDTPPQKSTAAALPHINAGNHSPIAIVNGDNNVVQAPPPSLRSMQRARGAPSETSRNKKSTGKKGKRR